MMSIKAASQPGSSSFLSKNKCKLMWILGIAVLAIGDYALLGIDSLDHGKVDANGFVSPWDASANSPESNLHKTTNADEAIKLVTKQEKAKKQNRALASGGEKKPKWGKTNLRTASADMGSIQ